MEYIYTITNTVNQKVYVGKTNNYENRKYTHLLNLRTGKHSNKDLQNDYNKYGVDVFEFKIVEQGETLTEDGTERKWMIDLKTYNPEYGYNTEDPFFRTFNGGKTKAMVAIENGLPVDVRPKPKKEMKTVKYQEPKRKILVSEDQIKLVAEAMRFIAVFELLPEDKKNQIVGYMECLCDLNEREKKSISTTKT